MIELLTEAYTKVLDIMDSMSAVCPITGYKDGELDMRLFDLNEAAQKIEQAIVKIKGETNERYTKSN